MLHLSYRISTICVHKGKNHLVWCNSPTRFSTPLFYEISTIDFSNISPNWIRQLQCLQRWNFLPSWKNCKGEEFLLILLVFLNEIFFSNAVFVIQFCSWQKYYFQMLHLSYNIFNNIFFKNFYIWFFKHFWKLIMIVTTFQMIEIFSFMIKLQRGNFFSWYLCS